MTLSGEQWLDQVFRPAVAVANQARRERSTGRVSVDPLRVLGGRLAAQVEALGDTGILTDEQERAALDAIDEAGIAPEIGSTSASMSSSAATRTDPAPIEPPRLRGVLAGPRQLGQLDGRPVTLIAAELWSDRILVDLFTDPGPEYRARRTRATRERLDWMRRQRRGQAGERPGRTLAGSPLQDLTWTPHDGRGTEFHRTGGSAESGDHVDRLRMQWSPAPSPAAGHLTLRAVDATGTVVLDAELGVPGLAT